MRNRFRSVSQSFVHSHASDDRHRNGVGGRHSFACHLDGGASSLLLRHVCAVFVLRVQFNTHREAPYGSTSRDFNCVFYHVGSQ